MSNTCPTPTPANPGDASASLPAPSKASVAGANKGSPNRSDALPPVAASASTPNASGNGLPGPPA